MEIAHQTNVPLRARIVGIAHAKLVFAVMGYASFLMDKDVEHRLLVGKRLDFIEFLKPEAFEGTFGNEIIEHLVGNADGEISLVGKE